MTQLFLILRIENIPCQVFEVSKKKSNYSSSSGIRQFLYFLKHPVEKLMNWWTQLSQLMYSGSEWVGGGEKYKPDHRSCSGSCYGGKIYGIILSWFISMTMFCHTLKTETNTSSLKLLWRFITLPNPDLLAGHHPRPPTLGPGQAPHVHTMWPVSPICCPVHRSWACLYTFRHVIQVLLAGIFLP